MVFRYFYVSYYLLPKLLITVVHQIYSLQNLLDVVTPLRYGFAIEKTVDDFKFLHDFPDGLFLNCNNFLCLLLFSDGEGQFLVD